MQNFSHTPKMLTTPLIYAFLLADKAEGCFRPNGDEKMLCTEQILEASNFIVGRSCQLYH